ncbi:hypothetical protein [Paracoccus sp. J55]|uniref:hypothetical protein n=1 Tax=Paracoccus sp. J55 TaxID=935849 RepID=UPI00048D5406|nr:hypothetical protein [Paracoccus sp. J55]
MYMSDASDSPGIFRARVIGSITGCTNPESAELLPDGETFVFGNCALMVGHPAYRGGKGIVYLDKQAFISRAKIVNRDTVVLDERKLIDGLTATLGCDVLPVATDNFPAGTVFICEGANPITAPGGDSLFDPDTTYPRLLAFDPVAGKILGQIPLEEEGEIGQVYNRIDQPNGLAINGAGDIFFGDIPNGNPVSQLPPPVPSAIYRIPHDDIDYISDNMRSTGDAVQRIPTPGFVNGLTVSKDDDTLWMVSCSVHDPVKGGCYRITLEDFEAGVQPEPVIKGLGIIDGIAVSKRGTVFASTPQSGEIHAFGKDGSHKVIRIGDQDDRIVPMPADFNICYPKALDGEPALLVTDIAVGRAPETASVVVVDITGL